MSITAGEIMDLAAALLNDTEKQVYSYTAQLSYLKIALKELREWLELNNAPVTNEVSSVIVVPVGTTVVGFATTPALPSGLIEIQQVWERTTGIDPFVPMRRLEFIPHYIEGQSTNLFRIWVWRDNKIELPPANAVIDLKLDYIKTLFSTITDENSVIDVLNADSFLHYKTAALCARYIGENETRANGLDAQAYIARERMEGIDSKGKQQISVRHRPFRAGYKSRGY